jgi:anti-sigma regulatory factor (Ser/Thr protein kinase)
MSVPGLVHRGVSYDDPAGLGAALVPVLARAARARESVIVALDATVIGVLRDRLAEELLGRIVFLDVTRPARSDAFQLAARIATGVAGAARVGLRSYVVTQHQPGLGLTDAYWLRLEAALDEALRGLPVTLLCAYRLAGLPPAAATDGAGPTDGGPADGAQTDGAGPADAEVPPAFLAAHAELARVGDLDHPVANARHRDPADVVRGLPGAVVAPAPPDARRWAFDADGLAPLRRQLAAAVAASGLVAEAGEDLVYAVSEVATNAVEHGGGVGSLWTWVADGEVVCLVSGPGRLREPFPGVVPPSVDQDRGRGLWLARALCDEVDVSVDDDGTRVRLARRLVRSEPTTRQIR